ncbi:MAG: TIGR04076 family protein [Lachnospiraceae bacterium]|nr:TIGR04076 family protein [Lachnospiraceae bacterium]
MKVKIHVLKKGYDKELAEAFLTDGAEAGACPYHEVGDEFLYEGGAVMPEGFCPYAWHDIYPVLSQLTAGRELTNTWYKDPRVRVLCCTDAVRPVTFRLEQID